MYIVLNCCFLFLFLFGLFQTSIKCYALQTKNCMDSLVISVIFTNIKNKYNFLFVNVMNTICTKIKYFYIKRHNFYWPSDGAFNIKVFLKCKNVTCTRKITLRVLNMEKTIINIVNLTLWEYESKEYKMSTPYTGTVELGD